MLMQVRKVRPWGVPSSLRTPENEKETNPECSVDQGREQGHYQRRGRRVSIASETADYVPRGGGRIASRGTDIWIVVWVLEIIILAPRTQAEWAKYRTVILDMVGSLVPGA